jgi:CBS domain-containing protein
MALTAADVMTKDLRTVDPEMSLVVFERMLIALRIGGAPVLEGKKLVGMVSREDIIRVLSLEQSMAEVQSGVYAHSPDGAAQGAFNRVGDQVGQRMQELCVRDAMTTVRARVAPTASLQDVARQMVKHSVQRVLVADGDRLCGVVSRIDLVKLLAEGGLVEAPR